MADDAIHSGTVANSSVGSGGSAGRSADRTAHLYPIPPHGHIVAYSIYPRGSGSPHAAILGLTLSDDHFEVEIDGELHRAQALVAAPGISNIKPVDVSTVSFVFYPLNEINRSVRLLAPNPVKKLDRALFRIFDAELIAAWSGALDLPNARDLFIRVMTCLQAQLPKPAELDRRIAGVVELLATNPRSSVAELASAVSLSPDRLSHLFTEDVGIDLRRYRLWLKMEQVILLSGSGKTLSEIAELAGFSDVAHLSRAVKDFYGGSPTKFNMVVHG